MRLTRHTDLGLRLLMSLASTRGQRSVAELASRHAVSRAHLVVVAHRLVKAGLLIATRGRYGGIRLAAPPEEITLGAVVRELEPDFHLAECFGRETSRCRIDGACQLRPVLRLASDAFLEVLDGHTLADITGNSEQLVQLLDLGGQTAARRSIHGA